MLDYLSLFLVVTLIAGVFGFVGTDGSVAGVAQIVFALFLGVSLLLMLLMRRRQKVT